MSTPNIFSRLNIDMARYRVNLGYLKLHTQITANRKPNILPLSNIHICQQKETADYIVTQKLTETKTRGPAMGSCDIAGKQKTGHARSARPRPRNQNSRSELAMQKIGKIRKMSIKDYTDYLKDRIKDENKGFVRKYIKAKIRHLTGKKSTGVKK